MPRAIVFHRGYGCDTGCCGHVVQLNDDERFVFDHAEATPNVYLTGYEMTDADIQTFVRRQVTEAFGAEHCADIDWDACIIRGDHEC